MKNKLLNFSGVNLSVTFDREKAEPIVENIVHGCNEDSFTAKPDAYINTLISLSSNDKSKFLDKIDTSITGDYLITEGNKISSEILDDKKELENIMRIMYTYEALQTGDTDLINSALRKLLYYLDPQFQRDNSDELLDEYIKNMSHDDMIKYLQDFLNENIDKSSFLTSLIVAKKEEEANRKYPSSRGGYAYAGAIPSIKAITQSINKPDNNSDNKKEPTADVKKLDKDPKKDVLKTDDKKDKIDDKTKPSKDKDDKKDKVKKPEDKKDSKKDVKPTNNKVSNNTNSVLPGKAVATSISGLAENGIETVKDFIANGKKIKENLDGTLSSSINSIARYGMKTIKPLVKTVNENVGNSSAVLPGIAGLSSAAVAGLGTKAYINKKEKKESDKEESGQTFFQEFEEDADSNEGIINDSIMSRDDLVRALENKR